MYRAYTAGDIHLFVHEVRPQPLKRIKKRCVTGLHIGIGRTGKEIGKENGVSYHFGLFAEWTPVLVEVAAACYNTPGISPTFSIAAAAPVDKEVRHIQVFLLARCTIQFNRRHYNRRITWKIRQLRVASLERLVNIIRCFAGNVEQCRLAGNPVMNAGSGDKVTHCVQLVMIWDLEPWPVAGNRLGGDITIRPLCHSNHVDNFIHLFIEFPLIGNRVDVTGALKPLVNPGILPMGPLELTFLDAGGNSQVLYSVSLLRVRCQLPQPRERDIACLGKPLRPETLGPANSSQVNAP